MIKWRCVGDLKIEKALFLDLGGVFTLQKFSKLHTYGFCIFCMYSSNFLVVLGFELSAF
jgi:hypothetical protein